MNLEEAKKALDKVIRKTRSHFYKPIQIAEVLYRDRVIGDINLLQLDTYRTVSRRWRDHICLEFVGRTSTSSARYQDDVFNDNATPPSILAILGQENRNHQGIVEAYIYRNFFQRLSQMSSGLDYCQQHDQNHFRLEEFLQLFWLEPGLKRSIDKIYEIVVYALFSAIIDCLEISVKVTVSEMKVNILKEFSDFSEKVLQLSPADPCLEIKGQLHRVGTTNAADRGLDMWANFGLTIQIKHLSLTEELAEGIVNEVSSDRMVIICKDAEQKMIISLLNQIGWRSKIQSIITEKELINWYNKALRGRYADVLAEKVLSNLRQEIAVEFPTTDHQKFLAFRDERGYSHLQNSCWP